SERTRGNSRDKGRLQDIQTASPQERASRQTPSALRARPGCSQPVRPPQDEVRSIRDVKDWELRAAGQQVAVLVAQWEGGIRRPANGKETRPMQKGTPMQKGDANFSGNVPGH